MLKRMRVVWFVGLAAILLTNCAHVSSFFDDSKDERVVFLNHDLQRTLEVDSKVHVEREKDDVLKIHVKMKNITDQEILHVQAQTLWSDAGGKTLPEDASWQTLAITPGQAVTYEATAPSAEAKNFTVRVRYLALMTPEQLSNQK